MLHYKHKKHSWPPTDTRQRQNHVRKQHQTAITDNTGAAAWETERAMFALQTTITITRNTTSGTVSGIDALMVTLMMSEIYDGAINK